MAAEELILQLLRTTNRPYNAQLVTDMLATKGVKKGPAEKALEALSSQGKLVRKEYGKQKIYFPSQEGLAALSPEESAAKQQSLKELQQAVRAAEEAVAAMRREVAAASSVLTLEQMQQQLTQLEEQKAAQEEKLAGLRGGGARRVSAADMAAVEKAFSAYFEAWARHRRQFRAVWDCVAEGMEGKEEHLFEEMGVESDKAVGADFEGARAMVQPLKKARTVLAPIRRP